MSESILPPLLDDGLVLNNFDLSGDFVAAPPTPHFAQELLPSPQPEDLPTMNFDDDYQLPELPIAVVRRMSNTGKAPGPEKENALPISNEAPGSEEQSALSKLNEAPGSKEENAPPPPNEARGPEKALPLLLPCNEDDLVLECPESFLLEVLRHWGPTILSSRRSALHVALHCCFVDHSFQQAMCAAARLLYDLPRLRASRRRCPEH